MKKLTILNAVLLTTALLFTGCSNVSNNNSSAGASGEISGDPTGTGSGSTTTNSFELSDGNWTLLEKTTYNDGRPTSYKKFCITVSGGKTTFTSAYFGDEKKFSDVNLNDDSTDEEIEIKLAELNESYTGTPYSYTYDRKTKTIFSWAKASNDSLTGFAIVYNLNYLFSNKQLTTNTARTEYSFSEGTDTYILTKNL